MMMNNREKTETSRNENTSEYCPWLDTSCSLKSGDPLLNMPRKIPKKMKRLIDGDLATICDDRNLTSTQVRLREKLKRKQVGNVSKARTTTDTDTDIRTETDKRNKARKGKQIALNRKNIFSYDEPANTYDVHSNKSYNCGTEYDVHSHKRVSTNLASNKTLSVSKVDSSTQNMSYFWRKEKVRILATNLEHFRRDLRKRPLIELRDLKRKEHTSELKLEIYMFRLKMCLPQNILFQTLLKSITQTFSPNFKYHVRSSKLDDSVLTPTENMSQRSTRKTTRPEMEFVFSIIFLALCNHCHRNLRPKIQPPTELPGPAVSLPWSNKKEIEALVCHVLDRLVGLYRRSCLPPMLAFQALLTHAVAIENQILRIEISASMTIFRMFVKSSLEQVLAKPKIAQMNNSLSPNLQMDKMLLSRIAVAMAVSMLKDALLIQCPVHTDLIKGSNNELLTVIKSCIEVIIQTLEVDIPCVEMLYHVRKAIAATRSLGNPVIYANLLFLEEVVDMLSSRRNNDLTDSLLQDISEAADQQEVLSQENSLCEDNDYQEHYGIRLCMYS